MIDSGIYPHIGGKSTHMKNLSKGLDLNGHDVNIISAGNISFIAMFLLVRIPSYLLRKTPKYGQKYSFYWTTQALMYLTSRLIKSELKSTSYQAISCQDVVASSMCRRIISALELDIPILTTVHGDYANEIISAGYFKRGSDFEHWLINREVKGYLDSSMIIAVDNRLKDHVSFLWKDSSEKKPAINVMFNYLDIHEFRPVEKIKKSELREQFKSIRDDDMVIILCPRRLTAKNGVIYAAMMCNTLRDRNSNLKFQLIFAGEGEEKEKIEEYVLVNHLTSFVRMIGNVNHEHMTDLYGVSDIIIIPSVPSEGVIEATSLSVLEGMACGVPVIASNIGGLAELINHGDTGLLAEPKDINALAEGVLKLASQKEYYDHIRQNALAYVKKNHSHIIAAKQYAAFIDQAKSEAYRLKWQLS